MKSKKKYMIAVLALSATFLLSGCQEMTRHWGGTSTVNLPAGKKLVPYTVQWEPQSSDLWYLLEDAPADYKPKTYEFRETSNYGQMEGIIVFVEH
jgi:hypothetical protein